MKNPKHPLSILLTGAAILTAMCQSGCATTPTSSSQPSIADQIHIVDAKAKEVWVRSLEASFGEAGDDQEVQSMRLIGTMSMPSQGINATMNVLIAPAQGVHVMMDIPGLGAFEQGLSGDVAWSTNMMEGPKILEGPEAEQFRKQGDLYADLHWDKYYESITYKGQESVTMPDDSEIMADVLELVSIDTDDGTVSTQYFDVETGLMVKAVTTVVIAGGAKIPSTSYTTDYRDVGGLKVPFKTISSTGPMQQIIEFSSVEVNVEIGDGELALPEEIQELIEE